MTETKALILVVIAVLLLAGATGVALALTDAGGTAHGLAIVLLAALSGFASSRVVMHYDSLKERQRRGEILLKLR
jgi:hypothetical protein